MFDKLTFDGSLLFAMWAENENFLPQILRSFKKSCKKNSTEKTQSEPTKNQW